MGHIDQREAYRFPTALNADCRMTGETWSARLHNISTGGCMMACPQEGMPKGWMMRLRIKGLHTIDAEIMWCHRGHAGLRFMRPLEPGALEHLGYSLPAGASRSGGGAAGLHAQLVKRGAVGPGSAEAEQAAH